MSNKKLRKQKSKTPRMDKKKYEKELRRLQVELVSMQQWVVAADARVLIIFEGRDAAGKGGAIKRVMQYLNPRHARVVASRSPPSGRRASGTSSDTSSDFPRRARSCSWTGPGTTAPASRR